MRPSDLAASPYAQQGALSDPRHHGALCADLPDEIGALCRIVQGLLIHDYYGLHLYGEPPAHVVGASRATLPVAARLDAILAAEAAPLTAPRAPFARAVGTCRDFALLLCALLRQQGRPARVRCGFARYFGDDGWEDHWLCEYWKPGEDRWALADPQLDEPHRARLGISFDPAELPRGEFLRAWEAWQRCRDDPVAAERFGHGEVTGAWFLQVNLARDLLALCKREVSAWDAWREAPLRSLDDAARRRCDRLAALAKAAGALTPPALDAAAIEDLQARPSW